MSANQGRTRRKPQISETLPPPPPAPTLADYEPIIGKSQLDELRFVARALKGKPVKMVNSTAMGGGVAEMLNRLVPLLDELEVKTGWEVITGGNDCFEVTKGFHNALYGADFTFTQAARDVFLATTEQNRQRMTFDEDFVVIHDPQPAGLIASKSGSSHLPISCVVILPTLKPPASICASAKELVCSSPVAPAIQNTKSQPCCQPS
jgi:hypothetical protein